jgi:hypothetical protein
MMGYRRFRRMSDEDVQPVVAYLNTLPPVRNRLPRTALAFPVSLLIMSWLGFAQMEPGDLKAIYASLMRQPPVKN